MEFWPAIYRRRARQSMGCFTMRATPEGAQVHAAAAPLHAHTEGSSCTGERRRGLLAAMLASALALHSPAARAEEAVGGAGGALEDAAFEAYAQRDFKRTVQLLTDLMGQQPQEQGRWLEMRAQVLVDGKNFEAALTDYNAALALTTDLEPVVRARLHAGRALALEGVSDWAGALREYDLAMADAGSAGESPDPYIINSRGNCYNSLGQWAEARENYLVSSQLFQQARGFRGRGGSTTDRLDGAVFAASNAALMLAQMGDLEAAVKEMERIARRAPGSADMRAALAALYYDLGQRARAEDQWEFACDKITVGCSKYRDRDWLQRIRRWPPLMVDKMSRFIELQPTA